jgi:phage shock protein A
MGIFSRVSDILTANLNALLDRAEDPEALLAQVVREMEDGLARARRSAAAAIAAERRLRRERDDHRVRADHWKGRAAEALAAGREDLARRALARKQEHDALTRSLEEQHAEALRTGDSARTALRALEARLAEARRKQRTLLARRRAAQVRVEVGRHLGAGRADFGASQARFDRLEARLNQSVDELDADADLHDLARLEAEFTDLERQRLIDGELAALKREREGRS